jgi:gliding motility-associated-like protein
MRCLIILLVFFCVCINKQATAQCAGTLSFTVSPLPNASGTFPPNTTVTICVTMTNYTMVNANWVDGFEFQFGPCWNMATLVPITPPTTQGASAGNWGWYTSVIGSFSGASNGPGFFFDLNNDGNPGNDFGDFSTTGVWTMCVQISTSNIAGAACNIGVQPLSDSQIGSWSGTGCNDPITPIIPANITIGTGCNLAVNINSTNPTCTAQGSAQAIIVGGTAPFVYTWNVSPPQTSSTINNLPAGSYIVTVIDDSMCIVNDTVTLINPTAFSLSTSTTAVLCNGTATGTATITPANGIAPYTYLWNTTPAQTTATATNLIAGSYTCVVTDNANCTNSATVIVMQPNVLSITTGQTNVNCTSSSSAIAWASATGGTAPYTFIGGNSIFTFTNDTLFNIPIGIYFFKVIDANGCSDSISFTISANPNFLIQSNVINNITCNGLQNGQIAVSIAGGQTPYTYNWTGFAANNTNTLSNLWPGTYYLSVVESQFGCIINDSFIITQPTALVNSFNITNVSCYGLNNGIATCIVTGGTVPYTYWFNNQTSATITTGWGNYPVIITDSFGCTLLDTAIITQPTPILISNTTTPVNCLGIATGTATVNVSGGTAPFLFSWNTTPIQTNSTANGLLVGNYIATATDANGCTAATTATIVANSPLLLQANVLNQVLCNGMATASAQAIPSGGTGIYTYSWSSTPVQTNAIASNLPIGNYTVTVTESNGCILTATVLITSPPALSIALTPTPVTCFGFNNGAVASSVTGGVSPYNYLWTGGATTTTINNLILGNYNLIITDANNCTASATATVSQPAQLLVTSIATPSSCQAASNGVINYTITGGIMPYTALLNNTPLIPPTLAINLYQGTYTIQVTDANNCSSSQITQVEYLPDIALQLSATDIYLHEQEQTNLSVAVSPYSGNYFYNWSPAATLNTPQQAATLAAPTTTTTYYIQVQNGTNQCTTTDSIVIYVMPNHIQIPNAFTPNNDGIDDTFYPLTWETVIVQQFKIYNRWGQLIFSSTSNPWDGKYLDELQPIGTYVYYFQYQLADGTTFSRQGDVSIIR